MITLQLTPDEATALKDACIEALQDDAEKLESVAWLVEDPQRADHVRRRFLALSGILPKLASV